MSVTHSKVEAALQSLSNSNPSGSVADGTPGTTGSPLLSVDKDGLVVSDNSSDDKPTEAVNGCGCRGNCVCSESE